MNQFPIPRRMRGNLGSELAIIGAAQQIAEAKVTAQRQVAMHATASQLHLRNLLREIEHFNPDAAPEAAVIVRIATSSMMAAMIEFGAEL